MGKSRDAANLVSTGGLKITINNDYVGIGSTVPISKLDVNGTVTSLELDVNGTATASNFNSLSDINEKNNISKIENALEIIQSINGVKFNWKKDNSPSLGVIAQDIESIIPEIVSGVNVKTVNYNGIIAVLIEAIKEQQIQINYLLEKNKT